MKIAFAAFVLAAGLMQTAVLADGNTGIVRGTVLRSDTGKPISNAFVFWVNPSGIGSTKTDAAGRFYLFDVLPGLTIVRSTASGFIMNCVKGYVRANETVDAVIPLARRGLWGCARLHSTGRQAVEDSP